MRQLLTHSQMKWLLIAVAPIEFRACGTLQGQPETLLCGHARRHCICDFLKQWLHVLW